VSSGATQALAAATLIVAVWLPGYLTARRLGRLGATEALLVGLGIGLFLLPALAFGLAWLIKTNISYVLIWSIGAAWTAALLLADRLRRPR